MDLTPQLSLGWQTWDDVEAVQFESARPDGPPDALGNAPDTGVYTAVPWAKRLDMTARELAASGGAYQAGDVTWLIPDVFLPGGAEPGDAIQVGDSERWNVLETTFNREDFIWELKARNPAVAFNLRDLIDVERPAITYDAAGAPVMLFPSGPAPNGGAVIYPKLVCKVQSVESDIAEERGIRGTQTKYNVYLSRQVVVTQYDRVNWQGVYLDIVATHNSEQIDELPYLECVAKV
jgi:hypothetical protein